MGNPFSIKDMLTAFSAANKRTFAHDRTKSVGGSDVGQCIRKTWLGKHIATHGFTPDEDFVQSSGATDRGSVYENEVWAPALKAHRPEGAKLLFAGDRQETLHDGFLSATPDGLFVNLDRACLSERGIPDIGAQVDDGAESFGCLVVECKTIDPRVNLKGAPKPEHAFQCQVQMGLIRSRTRYRPRFAIISYTDASFLDQVQEFVVAWDPAIYRAAQERADAIMTETDVTRLHPEGKWSPHARECEHCSFKTACADISISVIPARTEAEPVLSPEHDEQIEFLARQIATQTEAADLADRGKKIAQQRLRDLLREAGVSRATTSSLSKISWSPQAGRKIYDMDAIEAVLVEKGVELADFEKNGASFDRLSVTVYSADEIADKRAAEAAEQAAREDRERERAEKAAARAEEDAAKQRDREEKAAAKEAERQAKAAEKARLEAMSPAERKAEKARLKGLAEVD